ncbi:MAG: hypothetical protein ACK417_02575 [Bacteroidia bacterium]
MKKPVLLMSLLLMLAFACKKDNSPPNPFDDPSNKPPTNNNPTDPLSLENFAGIHRDIFKPTCSNSGCHDGTFEPDFRTIESSYNTLVNQPIIKNNPAGSFQLRVQPGNAANSILHERMVIDIDGISGIMPLSVDPQSDWPEKKTTYIQAIAAWINAGARDMFGNPPTNGPANPRLQGLYRDGNELLLAFYGRAPEEIRLLNRRTRRPIRRPVRPIRRPVRANNVFGEEVPFTHAISLSEFPAGSWLLLAPDQPEPLFEQITEALSIEKPD